MTTGRYDVLFGELAARGFFPVWLAIVLALIAVVAVGLLYRRRVAAPEMTLVFTALNIGLFAAVSAIGSGTSRPGSDSACLVC